MKSWSIVFDDFVPETEGLREALCTLGNGVFATRAAAPETRADGVHYPGTYVAGCYDRLDTTVAGRVVENEDLVNVPNWLSLGLRLGDGGWFDLERGVLLSYRQELDLRRGMLVRSVRYRDVMGHHTAIRQRWFVHMDDPHLAGLETVVVPEDWSGRLVVRSLLDGDVENTGVARYGSLRGDHLVGVDARAVDAETVLLETRTRQSGIDIAEAARTRLWRNGTPVKGRRRTVGASRSIGHSVALDVTSGDQATIEKIVALHTSRDPAISEAGLDARLRVARAPSFEDLLARHAHAWRRLWRRFDIAVDGSPRAQLVLRLHVFHLLQSVSQNSVGLDVGVPARGLHGEAYRGHIFWDELFVLPFLDLRLPALTESLLAYRHRRLDEARVAAEEAGFRGAMYPWQSASSGREETQTVHLNPKSGRWLPDNSHLQRHINIAIAFNVWHHFEATGDLQFLRVLGAPMILEIARFWSSLATTTRDDRFALRGVMGPDEYHDALPGASRPGLDNNAYTNVMVAWTLDRALELLKILPEHDRESLEDQLGLTSRELARWDRISRSLVVPFHRDGIISQFEGYEDLEEFDWVGYAERYGDIQRLDRILEAEGDSTNRYKVSKQADVLMLFYLLSPEELSRIFDRLGYRFDPRTEIRRNIDYYLQRTSHGSTLSRIVHSWVLARFDPRRSWKLFSLGLESDIEDVQGGTTAEGIHLGAMVGTLDVIQRCYGGVEIRNGEVLVRPQLPRGVRAIRFPVFYRRQRVDIHVAPDVVRIRVGAGGREIVRFRIGTEQMELLPGEEHEVRLTRRQSPGDRRGRTRQRPATGKPGLAQEP